MSHNSDEITREYFDSILISPRYIDSALPDISTNIFGTKYNTPVMTAALSHLHNICDNAMCKFAKGAKDAGALHFMGMGEDKELEEVLQTGADTVKIIKPHANEDEVYRRIEHAVSHGCKAVGMDIDHAFSGNGSYDNVFGLKMRPKTATQLREYIAASKVPFVVKGVLSPQDAEKAVDAGAAAILVSHHHAMMDSMVPPLMILPEIIKTWN